MTAASRPAPAARPVQPVAFLDDPARWILAVLLKELPPPDRFVTAVHQDGAFRDDP